MIGGGICGFCNLDKSFLIKEFKHWLWVYSEFPYWKYNTIVVSKSHKIKFSELSVDEMFELREIFSKVEKIYLEAGITKDNAGWGMDILWRQRVNTSGFETRSHIHIHLCPNQEGLFTNILDPEANKIDTSLLKKYL